MVLPLLIGLAALAGFGWLGFQVASFAVYWGSVAAGIGIVFLSLKYFLEEDPLPVTGRSDLNNILYLVYSIGLGLVGFKLVQAVFAVAGFTLAVLTVVFLVGGWFIGFGALIGLISSTLALLGGD